MENNVKTKENDMPHSSAALFKMALEKPRPNLLPETPHALTGYTRNKYSGWFVQSSQPQHNVIDAKLEELAALQRELVELRNSITEQNEIMSAHLAKLKRPDRGV